MPQLPENSLHTLSWRCPDEIAERSSAVWITGAAPRARRHLLCSWIPQAGAPGRRYAGLLRGTWLAGIFRLCRRRAGSVWRPYVDAGTIHAPRCAAAGLGMAVAIWKVHSSKGYLAVHE